MVELQFLRVMKSAQLLIGAYLQEDIHLNLYAVQNFKLFLMTIIKTRVTSGFFLQKMEKNITFANNTDYLSL
jgi:hypothetical protein